MSGLAGVMQRDGRPVDRQNLWAMLAAVPYRGPDGVQIRVWPSAGLGQAKMAVTPEEAQERQPAVSLRTGCAIVCDARLDNRQELLARLPHRVASSASDAQIILLAYEVWGTAGLAALLGDFAFIIWDPRSERMVCARDTSGQRSLFYRIDAQTFAAASEIQQLFQDVAHSPAPNEERIREFLVPLNMLRNEQDQATTFYAGIQALPAGHLLVVDRAETRLTRYWELKPPREIRYRDEAEYAEHYRSLLFEVVGARLRTAGPIGVLLSGGLDSTSVACVAQELSNAGAAPAHGLTGFSFVFDGMECDERQFIDDIQAKYGFETRFVSAGNYGGRLQLQPRGFMESPNMGVAEGRDAIFSAASTAGIRVLLTGETADACVLGSRQVFDSLLRHHRFGLFWRHLRAYRRVADESLARTLALRCLTPLLPLGLQKPILRIDLHYAFRRYGLRMLPSWMLPQLRTELCQRYEQDARAELAARRFASPARQEEYNLLYPPEVARHPVPWPLELWRPFTDRRLHEFLLAIPPELKFEPHPDSDEFYAGAKRLVRRAMAGILPESVRTRTTKTVFKAVMTSEVERQWAQFEQAFGPFARPEVAERGYIDRERFWQRLNELRAGAWGNDVIYLMQVVGLETWLRALKLPRPQLVTVPPPWTGVQTNAEIGARKAALVA